MIIETLSVLYFFVPAYIANMVPVFVRRLPFMGWPLDFGSTLRGKRLFGDHKTWRGLLSGVLGGILAFWLQSLAHANGFTAWSLIHYPAFPIWLGGAIAFGSLMGDALESTVKRQFGIGPGGSLFVWDQIDFLLGAMLVTIPYWLSVWRAALLALLVVFLLNILSQKIGYWTGLKDDPL